MAYQVNFLFFHAIMSVLPAQKQYKLTGGTRNDRTVNLSRFSQSLSLGTLIYTFRCLSTCLSLSLQTRGHSIVLR